MVPYELKNATLKQLRETRSAMMKLDYLLELENLPPEMQKKAALQLSNVQLAYLKLRKAQLADIRDGLKANEEDLTTSIKALQKSLKNLKKVENILRDVVSFLGVVGRVISLL